MINKYKQDIFPSSCFKFLYGFKNKLRLMIPVSFSYFSHETFPVPFIGFSRIFPFLFLWLFKSRNHLWFCILRNLFNSLSLPLSSSDLLANKKSSAFVVPHIVASIYACDSAPLSDPGCSPDPETLAPCWPTFLTSFTACWPSFIDPSLSI